MSYAFKSIDKRNGSLLIDSSGCAKGYFFAAIAPASTKKLKLRIFKDQNTYQTYTFKGDGSFEIFPLQFGNGNYQIVLYQNVYGTRYQTAGTINLFVQLEDKNAGFLVPNQYMNYHKIPDLISLSEALCLNKPNRKEKINAIKSYIKANYTYDYIKAIQIKKDMLPDMLGLMKKRTGICLDLAAFAVSMLRINKIPARLAIGMADNQYHAWVEIIGENNKYTKYDPTADISGKKIKKYISERFY